MSEVNYVLGHLYSEASENYIKSREYLQVPMQSDRTLKTKGYIKTEIKQSEAKPPIAKVWG